jgi:hypothetical protein
LADAFAKIQHPEKPDNRDWISLNPVAHELLGCAVGLAVGLGAEEPAAEHVLLAYLWRPDHEWLFGRVGTSRQRSTRSCASAARSSHT